MSLVTHAYTLGGGSSGGGSSTPKHGSKHMSNVSVTNAATQILAANSSRLQALIANNGSATMYLGKDNTVTSSNGIPITSGQYLIDDVTTDAWWGITASSTADTRTVEVY